MSETNPKAPREYIIPRDWQVSLLRELVSAYEGKTVDYHGAIHRARALLGQEGEK